MFAVPATRPDQQYLLAQENDIHILFGSMAILTGYIIWADKSGNVDIRLRWKALSPWDYNYSVTIQMFDRHRRLIAQADGPPMPHSLKSCWARGFQVIDFRKVNLLDEDTQEAKWMAIAVYDWKTLKHVPITASNGLVQGDFFWVDLQATLRKEQ